MKTKNVLSINPNAHCKGEHPSNSKTYPKKNRKNISYEKSLSGKVYSTAGWSRPKN